MKTEFEIYSFIFGLVLGPLLMLLTASIILLAKFGRYVDVIIKQSKP